MKGKRTIGLSAKVLQRKAKRRKTLAASLVVFGYTVLIAAGFIWSQNTMKYDALIRKTNADMALQQAKKNVMETSPTWAEFKLAAPEEFHLNLHEAVSRTNPDGVPLFVTVNGEQWEIRQVDHFTDGNAEKAGHIQAETYCDQNIIVYIPSRYPSVLRANLWHEIMHSAACVHGGDAYWNSVNPTRFEHAGIKHLGEFLGDFTHNNPQFMTWMMY